MSRLVGWGLSVLTMTSVATVLLLVTGWGSAIASSVQSVVVANTASNPVPVREQNIDKNGNIAVHEQGVAAVHEQGTANVDVANTPNVGFDPSTLDGAGNLRVHEQGTANVNITNAAALPVHEQGTAEVESANNEVAASGGCDNSRSGGGSSCSLPALYTVPAGHEFVLEYVGADAFGSGGSNGAAGSVDGPGVFLPFDLQPVSAATSDSAGVYQASDSVHFVFSAGTQLGAEVFLPGAADASLEVYLGGYLQPTK